MANEFKVRKSLVVNGSGSVLLDVQGSQGQLFSITDSLSGSLFAVKDISGMPVMEAFSDNTVRMGQFGQKVLFVSQSRVGIGKETPLNATLDISGSVLITGSLGVSNISNTFFPFKSGSILDQSMLRQTDTASLIFGEDIVSTSPNARGITVNGLNYASLTLLVSTSLGTQGYGMGTKPGGRFAFSNTANNSEIFSLNQDANGTAFSIAYGTNVSFVGNVGINWPNIYTIPTKFYVSGSSRLDGTLKVGTLSTDNHQFTGSVGVSGSITSTGTITAQQLIVQTISSSISYASGSNRFGSLLTDTQSMTGSVGITGSLNVSGSTSFSGSVNIVSGSLTVASASLAVSGSLSINGVNITATGGFQQTFLAATTWTATHNLNTLYPVITVYNNSGQVIIPTSITSTDANTTTVTFNVAVAGTINILSGQLQQNIAVSNPTAVALSTVLGG